MPDYRLYRVPGDIYFFTVNPLERRAYLPVRHIEPLREAVKCTRAERPFYIDAWVVLPESHALRNCPTTGTMLFPIALRQSKLVLYRRCRRRRGVDRYELRRVNVAFDSRPSMAASLRALRIHIRCRWICGNGVFGSRLFGTREIMCAIWNACTSIGSNMAVCCWSRTGPIRHFIGGWRQMPIYGWDVAVGDRTIIW